MADAHDVIFYEDHGLTLTVKAYKKSDSSTNYTASSVAEDATEAGKYVASFTNLPDNDYSFSVLVGSTLYSKFTCTNVTSTIDPIYDDSLVPLRVTDFSDGGITVVSPLIGEDLTLSTHTYQTVDFLKPSGATWPADLTGLTIEFHIKIGTTNHKVGTMSIITATGSSQKVRLTLSASQAYSIHGWLPSSYVNAFGNAIQSELTSIGTYSVMAMSSNCTTTPPTALYAGNLAVNDLAYDNTNTHCVLS